MTLAVRQATLEDYLGETTEPNEPLAEPAAPTDATKTEQAAESTAPVKVHPFAAEFPMLSDEEANDLAESIKANGQIHAIVLDSNGLLIDGRNRLRACEIAGVEPRFTTFQGEGEDVDDFILANNIDRRHLSTGQRAMLVARRLERYKFVTLADGKNRDAAKVARIAKPRISEAIAVLDYAPDHADAVISGATPLHVALKVAHERKNAADSTEALLTKLRAEAPDLADQVVEGTLTLREALAAHRERVETVRSARRIATDSIDKALTYIGPINPMWSPEQAAGHLVDLLDPELVPNKPEFSAERFHRAAAVLEAMAHKIEGAN